MRRLIRREANSKEAGQAPLRNRGRHFSGSGIPQEEGQAPSKAFLRKWGRHSSGSGAGALAFQAAALAGPGRREKTNRAGPGRTENPTGRKNKLRRSNHYGPALLAKLLPGSGKKKKRKRAQIQLGVNHFGPALLAKLLLPALRAAAPSRLVFLVSTSVQGPGLEGRN